MRWPEVCRAAGAATSESGLSPLSLLLIGAAMSTDAFAAALGKGAAMRRPRFVEALRIGLLFGVIEAVMPVIGWWLGQAAAGVIEGWDHWVALALLSALGAHMIHAGLRHDDDAPDRPERHGWLRLAATGFATSIDAMAVGIGLALLDVPILWVALVIGLCTLVMVTVGVLLGHAMGALAGKRAEIMGGLILIFVGVAIAYEHVNEAPSGAAPVAMSQPR